VTFLFGGGPGRRDPELAAAARRRREAFARDIGDEQGLAASREEPVTRRRRRRWTPLIFIVLVLFSTVGAIPLLRAGNVGGIVRPQCDHPVVRVSAGEVRPGHQAAWQAAGPAQGPYVITLDAAKVTVTAGEAVTVPSGRLLAGPLSLSGCRSRQTLFDAPTEPGEHLVTLFRRTASGYQGVARTVLRVG
jgi:hypothetical protein